MKTYKNIAEYMTPYWSGKTVYRESVLFCTDTQGVPAPAHLLYPPKEVLSVMSATEEITYEKGKDYYMKNGELTLLSDSSIPCTPFSVLYPNQPVANHSFNKTGGGYIYFSEGTVFHNMQTLVTYTHDTKWSGPIPEDKSALLPVTTGHIRDHDLSHILVIGDSITEGANSSGPIHTPPYLGSWWQLVGCYLQAVSGKEIDVSSIAMGGQISSWGATEAKKAAPDQHPDLIIIAFGMNDGTHKVPPQDFRANVASIIQAFRAMRPETEFILVGSILPNPEARDFVGYQEQNRDMLLELQGKGIAVADVTTMHKAFLEHKAYGDMTGNNVNHLNDFLARLQAQVVLRTMGIGIV